MLNLTCKILHLEDDDNDSLFFQRALTRLQFTGSYRRVSTVAAAMKYLDGTDEFAERRLFPLPDVLVMDSALSGAQSTDDLMTWLNERNEFRRLVRVMLTGGVSPANQESWIARGVAAVLTKGTSITDFAGSVEEVLRRCVVIRT
jgi:CheY-like chemotaxis protein